MKRSFEAEAETRFVALESKIAFQEKLLADLNDVIVEQDRSLAELRRQVAVLEQQLRSLADAHDQPHEQPPHY